MLGLLRDALTVTNGPTDNSPDVYQVTVPRATVEPEKNYENEFVHEYR